MTTVAANGHRTAFVDNDQKPNGRGRMLRKEDPRFVRGRGRYVDDLQLPGMLHLAILRSPLAHARILSVDTTLAEAHPKVRLVVINQDAPSMIAEITRVIGSAGINIHSFKNESNGKVGYNLIDTEADVSAAVVDQLAKLDKVIFVRKIALG